MKTPIQESLSRIEDACSGKELKDFYVYKDASQLLLSLLTPVNHSRFRRKWREFQRLQRSNGGSGCTIESFLSKPSSHATPRPPHKPG